MKITDNIYAFFWTDFSINNCNTYLVMDGKKVLIDPGHYQLFGHVADGLSAMGLTPDDIDLVIVTHGHPDHIEGVKRFWGKDILVAIGEVEMELLRKIAPHYGEALGITDFEPHILLREGRLEVGEMVFEVIHTPGHSPGSICLYLPSQKALFSGDVIFNEGIGRTDLPGGDGSLLKQSIKRLSKLDLELVLPGHGEIIAGKENVRANFMEIESFWFAYI